MSANCYTALLKRTRR
uniref:Uncharacterized protein n=1 Tax=Arundo donax TaxID=35708 RepID=A0A0A9ARQ2_ARUDO